MQPAENNSVVSCNDTSEEIMSYAGDRSSMAKEERKKQVLQLLADTDLSLTPYVILHNLKMRGATFERRTLANYLNELVDEGRIQRLDTSTTMYQITQKGRESLQED